MFLVYHKITQIVLLNISKKAGAGFIFPFPAAVTQRMEGKTIYHSIINARGSEQTTWQYRIQVKTVTKRWGLTSLLDLQYGSFSNRVLVNHRGGVFVLSWG